MYSPFNFSFQNANQPTRAGSMTNSSNFLRNFQPFTTFAAVASGFSGFSTSLLLPMKQHNEMIMSPKTIHCDGQQVLGEEYLQNFQMHNKKEFCDFSNMPASPPQNQNFYKPNNYINGNGMHSSRQHHLPNSSTHLYHQRTEALPERRSNMMNPKDIVTTIFQNCQRMTSAYCQKSLNQNDGNSSSHPRWHWKRKDKKVSTTNRKAAHKNYHERSRSNLEQNIHEDIAPTVTFSEMNTAQSSRKCQSSSLTDEASRQDAPIFIYSEIEFPAIKNTIDKPAKSKRKRKNKDEKRNCGRRTSLRKSESDYVVIAPEASILTPTFEPMKKSLCDRIINSPRKLLPCSKKFPIKPILKMSSARRSFSESSDDWIEFVPGDSSDTSKNFDFEDDNCSISEESEDFEDEESSAEEDDDNSEEQHRSPCQVDSGLEEKRVSESFVNFLNHKKLTFF